MQGSCGPERSGTNTVAASGATALHVVKGAGRSLMTGGRGVAVGAGVSARAMGPAIQTSVRRAGGGAATTIVLTTTLTVTSELATVALRSVGGGGTQKGHKLLYLREHHGGFASLKIRFTALERVGKFRRCRSRVGKRQHGVKREDVERRGARSAAMDSTVLA